MAQKINVQKLVELTGLGKTRQHGDITLPSVFSAYALNNISTYISEGDSQSVQILKKAKSVSFDDVIKSDIFSMEIYPADNNNNSNSNDGSNIRITGLSDESLAILMAAVYRDQVEIFAQIKGDAHLIEKLFGQNMIQDSIEPMDIQPLELDNQKKTINWQDMNNLVVVDWSDPDYVLANFANTPNILNQADEALWFHPKTQKLFFKAVFSSMNANLCLANMLKTLGTEKTDRILLNENMVDFMLHMPGYFTKMYDYYYKFKLGTTDIKDFSLDNIPIGLHEDEALRQRVQNQIKSCLQNRDNALNYVSERTGASFYHYLPEEFKTDIQIYQQTLNAIRQSKEYSEFYTQLPEAFLKNQDNMAALIITLLPMCDDLAGKRIQKLANTWKGSRQDVFYFMDCCESDKDLKSSGQIKNFYKVFEYLDADLKNDVELVSHFVSHHPYIYQIPLISKALQANADVMIAYLNNYQVNMEYLEESWVFAVQDEEKIKKLVARHPDFLKSPDCPKAWLENLDILKQTGEDLLNYHISQTVWKKICDNPEYCASLVKENSFQIYRFLPEPIRANAQVLDSFIQGIAPRSTSETLLKVYKREYDAIPAQIWNDPDTALQVIKSLPNDLTAQALPAIHFNNPQFVKELFEAIDNKMIPEKLFRYFPHEVSEFIASISQKGGLANAFSKGILNNQLSRDLPQNPDTDDSEPPRMKI
jgi:hypothetical protein